MKRFLKALLMLTVIIAACVILNPTKAHAETYGKLSYAVSNGVVTITGCDSTISGDLTIPATINDMAVTAIAKKTFYNCDNLTSVTVTSGTIGEYAFYSCDNLTSVTLGDGVTSVSRYAFQDCANLKSIAIGKSVKSIGHYAFGNCTNLAGVYITSIANWCSIAFDSANSSVYSNPLTYAGNLYLNGELVTKLTIPSGITTISDRAFYNCDSLTEVIVEDNITAIGISSFAGCNNLSKVTLSNSVTRICNSAFDSCTELTAIALGNSVTTIGSCAFYNCDKLTAIKIPDSVTSIGGSAFYNCDNLSTVTLGSSINTIGDSAFQDCDKLTSISIPGSATSIGNSAFYDCDNLISATITSGTVGEYAFYSCDNLTSVTLGDGVTNIYQCAFRYCANLKSISVGTGLSSVGSYAFDSCAGIQTVYYSGTEAQWKTISIRSGNSKLQNAKIIYNYTIKPYVGIYGELTYKISNGTIIITECNPFAAGDVIIPATIDGYAVTTIGSYAFSHCDTLTGITIPEGVVTIGDSAFLDCAKLTQITIPSTVTSIGKSAFEDCVSLESIEIPEGVTAINAFTFYNCENLTDVTIPVSVTVIGNKAFYRCPNLKNVDYPGTQEQWDAIEIAGGNDDLKNAKIISIFKFENYRIVFADSDTTHKNVRAIVYKLGNKTVTDPTNENALKAIDPNAVTKWGIGDINKILLTDAGNYVVLLKYNVGTAVVRVPLVLKVTSDPKLIIDKNNKITALDSNVENINHRVVVYYLGDQTVADIYDEAALLAIDSQPETIWKLNYINRFALTKGGNYVLHLCYNEGQSAKITVAQQFSVYAIPSVSVNNNNMLVATEENDENRNHRATVFYLGDTLVEDPFDEAEVSAAAISSKTYWGLKEINGIELTQGGNYVIHLYYNVGTSEKRTLALDVTLNERPTLKVDLSNILVVSYTDPAISNLRAYIYKVGDAEIADIYDEAALKAIATPTQVWGLSSIQKKTLTPGTYVIHLYYSVGTSAKKTVAIKVTI